VIFSTQVFLFLFLPPVLLVSTFLKTKRQNLFLLLASLFFYAWGEGALVLLLLGSALLNHLFGLAIAAAAPRRRKLALGAGLACNLGLLAAFKYAPFIAALLAPLLRAAGLGAWQAAALPLPLGISFFTFMAIAYLVEVYNGSCPVERNFLHTALFITFFPTVLAGPINRYSRLREQLRDRQPSRELLAAGVQRFIIGLGKKALLADALARIADPVFALPAAGLPSGLAWLGAIAYSLQIFLDFSGYSDMAIGLGLMFGFRFMENFNYPYAARSIKEFWDRWHISLSSWLRDFLFLPLAYAISRRIPGDRWLGVRADAWCYYPAMFATMVLCGLWHGASWTFIAWGAYHGLFIMLERAVLRKPLKRLWPPLQVAYGLLVVSCGWVLFRAGDFSQAAAYWRAMVGLGNSGAQGYAPLAYLDNQALFILLLAVLAAFPVLPAARRGGEALRARCGCRGRSWLHAGGLLLNHAFLVLVLLASAMELAMTQYNPFIYFRF
jgi:alginate O-acetyltransferase complex protein AlgI